MELRIWEWTSKYAQCLFLVVVQQFTGAKFKINYNIYTLFCFRLPFNSEYSLADLRGLVSVSSVLIAQRSAGAFRLLQRIQINIVTDLINTLLGNDPVNTFKKEPTTIEEMFPLGPRFASCYATCAKHFPPLKRR
jgi:hypothetical protein